MPGDPAGVGGAPPRILLLEIEHPLERRRHTDHVAAVRVQDCFRLAGRAAGVEQKKRVFSIHGFGRDAGFGDGQVHQVVVPQVAARLHVNLLPGALDHDHGLDRRRALERLVHDLLERHDIAAQPRAVRRDGDLALAVLDAPVQRLDRKAAVHHRMHRADLGASQHGDHDLRDAAHVDRHAVALVDAHGAQHAGEAAHFALELVVGVAALLVLLALPQQRDLVAPPRFGVPVQRVVHDVDLAADEPLVEGRLGVIERLVPGLEPLELVAGDGAPRPRQVVEHGLVNGVRVGLVGLPDDVLRRVKDLAGCVAVAAHVSFPFRSPSRS